MRHRTTLLFLLGAACYDVRDDALPPRACVVSNMTYTPAQQVLSTSYTAGSRGFPGGHTSTTTTIPAAYALVLRCDPGTLTVEGDAAKQVFGAVREGDHVTATVVHRVHVYDDREEPQGVVVKRVVAQ